MEGFPWYIKMCILPNFESIGPQFFSDGDMAVPKNTKYIYDLSNKCPPKSHLFSLKVYLKSIKWWLYFLSNRIPMEKPTMDSKN